MDQRIGSMAVEAGTRGSGFGALLRLGLAAHAPLLWLAAAYLAVYLVLGLMVPGAHAADGAEVMLGIVSFSLPAVLFGLLTYTSS